MKAKKWIIDGIAVVAMGVCGTVFGVGASPSQEVSEMVDGTCEMAAKEEVKTRYKVFHVEVNNPNAHQYIEPKTKEVYVPQAKESISYLLNGLTGELSLLGLTEEGQMVKTLWEGTENLDHGSYSFHFINFRSAAKLVLLDRFTGRIFDLMPRKHVELVSDKEGTYVINQVGMDSGNVVFYGNEHTGELYKVNWTEEDGFRKMLVEGTDKLERGTYALHEVTVCKFMKAVWMNEETGRMFSIGHGDGGYYVYENTLVEYEEGMDIKDCHNVCERESVEEPEVAEVAWGDWLYEKLPDLMK